MSSSVGVEQGEADYLGAIARRIYVQLPLFSFAAISVLLMDTCAMCIVQCPYFHRMPALFAIVHFLEMCIIPQILILCIIRRF